MKLIFFLFVCCFFFACNDKPSTGMSVSDEDVAVISMNTKLNDVLNLSEFAESVELIPLETTDDCLIGWIPEIIATKNYYYMVSAVGYDFQKLYVFDKQGKFVRQISSRGQGGGEFIEVRDFDVVGDSIIKMGDVYAIRTFDIAGKQLSCKKINTEGISTREIVSMKGKTILFNMGNPNSKSAENLLFQLDEKDSLQARFFEVPYLANRISTYFVDAAALTKSDDFVYFHFPYSNYIYRINAETLLCEPYYKVDYGERNFTWDMFDENGREEIWSQQRQDTENLMGIDEILSLNDYFFFTSVDADYNGYATFYSTRTGKVLSGQRIKDDMYFKGYQVNLETGPGKTLTRHCNDNGDLIWVLQPSVLLKGYKSYRDVLSKDRWSLFCRKYPHLVEVCEHLKFDDNPVLLKIRLKKF